MAKRTFGLALLICRGRDSRGLVKACCQVDLFLACRHTRTAWIKVWAEVSDFLPRQQGHDNDDQSQTLGVAGVSSRGSGSHQSAPRWELFIRWHRQDGSAWP